MQLLVKADDILLSLSALQDIPDRRLQQAATKSAVRVRQIRHLYFCLKTKGSKTYFCHRQLLTEVTTETSPYTTPRMSNITQKKHPLAEKCSHLEQMVKVYSPLTL